MSPSDPLPLTARSHHYIAEAGRQKEPRLAKPSSANQLSNSAGQLERAEGTGLLDYGLRGDHIPAGRSELAANTGGDSANGSSRR
jgi:hypothetical protein